MKNFGSFLLGVILDIVGIVLILMNVRVSGFTLFYRYNGFNVGGLLILLICISFIVFFVKTNLLSGVVFCLLCLLFLVMLIVSIDIRFVSMSAFKLVLILGTLCTGIALTIKGLLNTK